MSFLSSLGLTILYEPPITGSTIAETFGDLSETVTGYTHTIGADGGYKSATISTTQPQRIIEEWLESGLNRKITVYNRASQIIWQGFVNILNSNFGSMNISLECAGFGEWLNKYTYTNTTSGLTTASTRIEAALAADPNGIMSTDYTGITANTLPIDSYTNDSKLAGNYIAGIAARGDTAFNRWTFGIYAGQRGIYAPIPNTSEYQCSLSSSNMTIRYGPVLGIGNQVSLVYSTVDTSVTPPAVGVRKETATNDDLVSQAKYGIIRKVLSSGGCTAANADIIRDVFLAEGAYPVTTQTLTMTGMHIKTDYGADVFPWNVLPGKIVFIDDFMAGRSIDYVHLRRDMRFMFIEQVKFTAPYSLELVGSRVQKLPQLLAQLGLMGVGA
jgi:hypothetical protein